MKSQNWGEVVVGIVRETLCKKMRQNFITSLGGKVEIKESYMNISELGQGSREKFLKSQFPKNLQDL